jgi:hypothetical protein
MAAGNFAQRSCFRSPSAQMLNVTEGDGAMVPIGDGAFWDVINPEPADTTGTGSPPLEEIPAIAVRLRDIGRLFRRQAASFSPFIFQSQFGSAEDIASDELHMCRRNIC